MIGLPTINPEVDGNDQGEAMSLSFTLTEFRKMDRREFYRLAIRSILESGRCPPCHEEWLINELRREERAYR